jgi:HEAT repeat protein
VARSFEERLAAVRRAAVSPDDPDARRVLLQALRGTNGFLVSVVVEAAGERFLDALPDAFARLLEDPIKRDPNCWGKIAVAKALYDADVRVDEVYLAGSRHVQLEPVMGGRQDTAAALRGTCIMALAHQQHPRAMVEAARLVVDPERPARVAAVRALAASGNADVAEPLLRLKIATGDDDPEVLGECFAALLELAPEPSLPLVTAFLDGKSDDGAEAAALALGGSRLPAAFGPLRERAEAFSGVSRRRALLLAIALLRRDDAWKYLVDRIEDAAPATAVAAIEALGTFRHDASLRQQVLDAATRRGDARVLESVRTTFAMDEE